MTVLAREMSAIVGWLAHSLVLPFLGIGKRIDLYQSCGHCWVFQICWHNECKTLMVSSFRDLNSSGISSHALALLTVVLLKAYLTLYFRMSGSGWLTTPSFLMPRNHFKMLKMEADILIRGAEALEWVLPTEWGVGGYLLEDQIHIKWVVREELELERAWSEDQAKGMWWMRWYLGREVAKGPGVGDGDE